MRPAAVTVVLLVVLMFMSDCATSSLSEYCQNRCPAVACPKEGKEDWFQLGQDRCLKAFFFTPHLNFTDAENTCVNYGGHLVSIHDEEEQNQVVCTMYRLTSRGPPYWIGLKLSFHYEDNLIYDWTDGTDFNFNRFAPQQPNFYNEQEECIEINYYYMGWWNDIYCGYLRGYVCAVKI